MVKTRKNLTGLRFGKLVVIKQTEDYVSPKGKHEAKWLCKCDCGNEVSVLGSCLNEDNTKGTKSCGCVSKEFIRTLTKPRKNLAGQVFGKLLVLRRANDYVTNQNKHYSVWLCECSCGELVNVHQSKLLNGHTKSCGCLRSEEISKRRSADLIGERFEKLVVVKRCGSFIDTNGVKKSSAWLCKCDCGNYKTARASSLINGDTSSCGCMKSKGEYKVQCLLNNNNIDFKTQYWFDELRSDTGTPLYFDFAILKNDEVVLIEYQGEQHYIDKDFGRLQREVTDKMKKEYCIKNNIQLFEIKYDDDIEKSLNLILETINI